MVGEQQIEQRPRSLRYFVAKFGEEHEDEHPVEHGCYPLRCRYWPGNFLASTPNSPIRAGDVVLLYCFKNYLEHSDEISGLGIAYGIDEGSDKNTLWYHYLPLVSPIDSNAIRTRLTHPNLLDDLHNILDAGRTSYCFLRMIKNQSARALLGECQINWP